MTTTTVEPMATEKQIQFIKSLVLGHEMSYRRAMPRTPDFTEADATGPRRGEYREYQANALLAQLWSQVKVPATMSQKRASAMIDRMKQSRATIVDTWLDNDKTAAAYGVLEFVNAHRDEIEKATA